MDIKLQAHNPVYVKTNKQRCGFILGGVIYPNTAERFSVLNITVLIFVRLNNTNLFYRRTIIVNTTRHLIA
jgi:hypothetical protein